jgi:hypothetical protein
METKNQCIDERLRPEPACNQFNVFRLSENRFSVIMWDLPDRSEGETRNQFDLMDILCL